MIFARRITISALVSQPSSRRLIECGRRGFPTAAAAAAMATLTTRISPFLTVATAVEIKRLEGEGGEKGLPTTFSRAFL